MPWITDDIQHGQGSIFGDLLAKHRPLLVPGVFNPLVGLAARRAGFRTLYVSGGALSATYGLPDLELLTLTEVRDMATRIQQVTNLPVIVDADTGFGAEFNVARAVRELELSGIAAIQIEDQASPKKCGHLDNKRLLSVEDMVSKLRAALKVRSDIRIIARTDARTVEGLDGAIERAKRYEEIGVDMIFPEALVNSEEFEAFADAISVPMIANMTEFGKTSYMTLDQFGELGYHLVLFPVTSLRLSMAAVMEGFRALAREGSQESLLNQMQTRRELYDLIGYDGYEEIERQLETGQHS